MSDKSATTSDSPEPPSPGATGCPSLPARNRPTDADRNWPGESENGVREKLVFYGGIAGALVLGAFLGYASAGLGAGQSAKPPSPKDPGQSRAEVVRFDLGADISKAFHREPTNIAIISEDKNAEQRRLREVRFDGNGSVDVPLRDASGVAFTLRAEFGDSVVSIPFYKDVKDGVYKLPFHVRWQLEKTEMRALGGKESDESVGLARGERVVVTAPKHGEVATVIARRDLKSIPLPVSNGGGFSYAVLRRTGHAEVQTRRDAAYLRDQRTLFVSLPKDRGFRIEDELTGESLEGTGRLVQSRDFLTTETLGLQFVPRNTDVVPSYYDAVRTRNTLRFRPRELRCKVECVDELTGSEIRAASSTSSPKAVYLPESGRWILPSPRDAMHLPDIKLRVAAEGYQSQMISIQKVVRMLHQDKGRLRLTMRRTHANVVIVWPTSRDMARVLGKDHIIRGKAFLNALKSELSKGCRKLGYEDVDLLLLRAKLGKQPDDLETLSYTASNNWKAMLPVDTAGSYSIYEDREFSNNVGIRNPFGHHTVVVVCLPADEIASPIKTLGERVRRVMHVHAVAIAPENDDPKNPARYAQKHLKTSCDSSSTIRSAATDIIRQEARRVADELIKKLKEQHGLGKETSNPRR